MKHELTTKQMELKTKHHQWNMSLYKTNGIKDKTSMKHELTTKQMELKTKHQWNMSLLQNKWN